MNNLSKIGIVSVFTLIIINIQCQKEEEECGEIHITGYVKSGINKKPLDSVDVLLWYGTSMDLGMRHTVSCRCK